MTSQPAPPGANQLVAGRAVSTIDLHVHTSASDGTFDPEEAVAAAAQSGVRVLGIADHDSLVGVAPALAAGQRLGVIVVPAVEINTDYGATEAHILGYFVDPCSRELNAALQDIRRRRLERAREMVARLRALGLALDENRVFDLAGEGDSGRRPSTGSEPAPSTCSGQALRAVGRPHVARALVEAGYVKTGAEAFARYIGRGQPAYVPRYRLTPTSAADAIRAAGGIPVLAHPAKVGDDLLVHSLLQQGLEGLEAFHCDHSAARARHYVALARQVGLIVTGGTDSHGPHSDRPVAIGATRVPRWVWDDLLEYANRKNV